MTDETRRLLDKLDHNLNDVIFDLVDENETLEGQVNELREQVARLTEKQNLKTVDVKLGGELIYRQAVLDAIEDDTRLGMYSRFASNDDAQCFKQVINELPSAENKGDLISRAEVLKHKEILRDDNRTGHQAVKTKYIRELPSAENKGEDRPKGQWKFRNDFPWRGQVRWECDKCGGLFKTDFNFCPNCGADMRGE